MLYRAPLAEATAWALRVHERKERINERLSGATQRFWESVVVAPRGDHHHRSPSLVLLSYILGILTLNGDRIRYTIKQVILSTDLDGYVRSITFIAAVVTFLIAEILPIQSLQRQPCKTSSGRYPLPCNAACQIVRARNRWR